MILKIKKLKENAVIPKRATTGSAGYDLCACIDENIVIGKGQIVKVPTGISAEINTNEAALMIYARSGLASKNGVTLVNCVGVVDSDYRGEIVVPLINLGNDDYILEKGARIAQLVVTPVLLPEIEEASELSETSRGFGGFGSTGK
ncbi:MAG: dUTP diphosphatase [Ruminococcus sp.]|nr:dUTP diphosphatase [Ruminococcus sp.]MBO5382973.1 dUTP diphosphatase [Ruminococcus sp.]MBR6669412.1 dUTP diphosphatase [Ruminococcus sp.]